MASTQLPAVLPFQPVRISVQRYHELVRAGAFTEHDRVELLNGVVTELMPKNPRHRTATRKCDLLLASLVGPGWHVQNQEPITLAASEPEPDVTVVRGALEDYSTRHPGPSDVALVVEVANTTLVTDRFKAEIYAGAGIPVYWIIDLGEERIEAFSQPNPAEVPPCYDVRATYGRGSQLSLVIDGCEVGVLAVSDLLP